MLLHHSHAITTRLSINIFVTKCRNILAKVHSTDPHPQRLMATKRKQDDTPNAELIDFLNGSIRTKGCLSTFVLFRTSWIREERLSNDSQSQRLQKSSSFHRQSRTANRVDQWRQRTRKWIFIFHDRRKIDALFSWINSRKASGKKSKRKSNNICRLEKSKSSNRIVTMKRALRSLN